MIRYIARRFLYVVFVFFVVSILMFGIYKMVPGDPARMMLDTSIANTDPEQYNKLYQEARERLGLDKPVVIQYVSWIGNMLRKIGNNMKVFNDRQRKISYPEVHFDTLDIELGAGAFTVAVRPQGAGAVDEAVAERVTAARNLRNDGTFAEAVRVELPCAESWNAQRDAAWEAWAAEHPEVLEEPDTDEEAPSGGVADEAAEPAPEKTREELLAEDVIAKSYENTAVPPTDSEALPRPQREEEEEEEDPFDFPVDYTLWAVIGADGATRTYDSVAAAFVG